jgi:hypothetical protein
VDINARSRAVLKRVSRLTLVLLLGVASACVSVQVDPLTSKEFEPRPGSEGVTTLQREPHHGHMQIARIIATSEYASEETLRDRILARAKELGADAVVLGEADVRRLADRGPTFQSTMGTGVPVGTSGNSYRSGYWNPFRMDAWSFTQGAGGGQGWMLHMSGLAIRYISADELGAAPSPVPAAP